MGREKKKGTSGNAKAFITRAKALKKLQLTVEEFRRLCILKGVYPRNPRKKTEGFDKTYYLRKDIDFLAHERLITTIREQNAHRKKVIKAKGKRRFDLLKRLALSVPRSRLDHLVVERYPRFTDALRDLDDPLCIIAMFANLPAEKKVGIAPERVANCQRLLREFCNFIVQNRSLTRVFVSIKGYYFQARVRNVNVTWVTPHRFTQVLPSDVDFPVMLTFLELYECILSFVNFRLYTEANLAYPPKVSRTADCNALHLDSLLVETAGTTKGIVSGITLGMERKSVESASISKDVVAKAQIMALSEVMEEEADDEERDEGGRCLDATGDANIEHSEGQSHYAEAECDKDSSQNRGEDMNESISKGIAEEDNETLDNMGIHDKPMLPAGVFSEKRVVLGREVPFVELEFTLRAAGAVMVTREDDLTSDGDCLDGYTHWIVDRPKIPKCQWNMSLEYVQPQYVFDSVNAGVLLPTCLYSAGAHLPPHLSPFVTKEHDGGYLPWFEEVLEKIKKGDASVIREAATVVYAEGEIRTKSKTDVLVEGGWGSIEERVTEAAEADRGGDESEEKVQDTQVDGKNVQDGEESMEEVDSEGEEEKAESTKQAAREAEDKQMATLMMSQKKLRRYKKIRGGELRQQAKKRKLMETRQKLKEERVELMTRTAKKRRMARQEA